MALALLPADYVMPHFDHAGPFKALVSLLRTQMKEWSAHDRH